ncbi:MAG TPA: DUF3857 and transglutaminase domain-containing protein [Blastocatellia bacterium]|nr:DUF3857 and transglutaminase domain-containing protein [Blastocatellia bacterium]
MVHRHVLIAILLAFASLAGQARASTNWRPVTPEDLKMTAADIGDPESEAVMLFREGELDDSSPEGTSLRVYIRIKVFNERGRRYADVQLPYRVELGRITEVRARTIRPDGTPVDVQGKDIFDKLLVKTGHGAWRAKVFSMPAVEQGAIIEYRYRQIYPKGFRYFALDIQSDLFTKELYYRIQPPLTTALDVRWVTFNAQDPKRFAPVLNDTYDIKAENIPPFRRESLMPPEQSVKIWGWLYYSDEAETDPVKYWREYAKRAHDRSNNETYPSRAIRRVVESITISTEGAREKIARIYDYIQNEIQNVGVRTEEDGDDGGAKPKRNNTADETIRRRYGTPREINRLFVAMLRAAGLDARVAELTTRDESFFHHSFPDAFQFNSEVAAVLGRDGSVQFYDPGTAYCPMGLLSWEKEAVPALIYGKRDSRFVETSITRASDNNYSRNMAITLSADGGVAAKVETRTTGQRALEFRNEMSAATTDEQRKRIGADVRRLLPGAAVDEESVSISGLVTATAPLTSSYSYSLPQFAQRTEKRLFLRPALLSHPDESLLVSPRRSNSIYFRYPWSEDERMVIDVPEGYTVEQLPAPVDIDIGAARYRARFALDGRRVVYERHLNVNAITLSVDQYATAKAFFDRVHQADRAVISFKQE